MSRSAKKKYLDNAASLGESDFFGTIYDGMCQSKQYQSLSIGARQFYTLCRVQSRSSHGKACLSRHGQEENTTYTDYCFCFPAKHLKLYGVDRSNANRYLNELINAGFIDLLEQNKHRKKINVYCFSSRWKQTSKE